MQWVLLAVIGLVASLFIFAKWSFEKRRSLKLQALSMRIGLQFDRENWPVGSRIPALEALQFAGHARGTATNVLAGQRNGFNVSFFDFSVSAGRSSYVQTVAAFSQEIWLPLFHLVPRTPVDWLTGTAFDKQIHFNSYPEFAKSFRVLSDDIEDRVKSIFTPELIRYLSERDPYTFCQIAGAGQSIFVFRRGKRVKVPEYPGFVEQSTDIASNFFGFWGVKKTEPVDIFQARKDEAQ